MNTRSKPFAAALSLIALTLGLSGTADAASSGQAETAVLVAAAALAGGQLIFTSSTGSKLEIDVDVYDPRSDNPRVAKLFELDHALALRSAMRPSDPVTHPTPRTLISVRDALLPWIAQIQTEQTSLAAAAKKLTGHPGSWQALADAYRELAARGQTALQDFNAFSSAVDVIENGDRTPVALMDAATKLRTLRADLAQPPAAHLDELVSVMKSRLPGIVQDIITVKPAPKLLPASSKFEFNAQDVSALMAKTQPTPRDSLVSMLDIVRQQLAHYDPATLDLLELDTVLRDDLAMQLTGKQLLAADGPADLLARLPLIIAGIRISDAMSRAYVLTFAGFTNGINTGPIADEVMQMLYSRGQTIAAITQDDNEVNWHRVNYAISDGGPGNHTALIYFENMLTPIIKNSSFDPTQFVVAEGEIYRRAFSSVAQVLSTTSGVPGTAGATTPAGSAAGGSGAGASNSVQSLNNLQQQIGQQQALDAQSQQAIVKALKTILDAKTALDANVNGDVWAGADDATKTKTQASAIKTAQDAINNLATSLNPPAASTPASSTPAAPAPAAPAPATPAPATPAPATPAPATPAPGDSSGGSGASGNGAAAKS